MILPPIGPLFTISEALERFLGFFGVELEVARRNGGRVFLIWLLAAVCIWLVGVVAARVIKAAED